MKNLLENMEQSYFMDKKHSKYYNSEVLWDGFILFYFLFEQSFHNSLENFDLYIPSNIN